MIERNDRERGELIATKIMAWHKRQLDREDRTMMDEDGYRDVIHSTEEWWCKANGEATKEVRGWYPASDLQQAMMVVERLTELGFDITMHRVTSAHDARAFCEIEDCVMVSSPVRGVWQASADALSRAIALASEQVAESIEAGESFTLLGRVKDE